MTKANRTKRVAGLMVVFITIIAFISLIPHTGETIEVNAEAETAQGQRVIEFAEQQWFVKSGCELGPGPNCWSDSDESVWVEDEQLHLKIRQIGGVWHTAEIYSQTCTQYGMHRFFTISRMDNMDKQVVAAMFIYKDDLTEVDIEFAKWGQDNPSHNGQYVVQPYTTPGNLEPFTFTLTGDFSTHYFDWRETSIQFKSIHGHHQEPPTQSHLIHEWLYMGSDIPNENECLKVHINLWLFRGMPPSNGQEVEFIIDNAQLPKLATRNIYLPMISKPAPSITVTAQGSQAWGKVSPPAYCNENYKIKFYAKTDIWYIQPFVATSDIQINSDCTWQSFTHFWYEVAAHLAPADYFPPATVGPPIPPCPPLNPQNNPNILATACYP